MKSGKKHIDVVKDRIKSVSTLQNVFATTKVLFYISKESIELEQKADLAYQTKSVLDSWVWYKDSLYKLQQKKLLNLLLRMSTSN